MGVKSVENQCVKSLRGNGLLMRVMKAWGILQPSEYQFPPRILSLSQSEYRLSTESRETFLGEIFFDLEKKKWKSNLYSILLWSPRNHSAIYGHCIKFQRQTAIDVILNINIDSRDNGGKDNDGRIFLHLISLYYDISK